MARSPAEAASGSRRCGATRAIRAALTGRPGGVYLDATFGVGGYSKAVLAAGAGRVLAIDRDPAAVERGRTIARDLPNLTVIQGRFADAATLTKAQEMGLNAANFLKINDSTRFYRRTGDLFVTGPTGTNVNDFRCVVVDKRIFDGQ